MRQNIFILLGCCIFLACNPSADETDESKQDSTNMSTSSGARDYEFGDDKYKDIANASLSALGSGDITGFAASISDNAIFRWNGGDSLAGKPAIVEYWKKRRAEVIDSLSYTGQIWLAIKVDKPMAEGQLTGNYALGWNMVHAKYKSGKRMSQRMHMIYHFDSNNNIDRITQYLDRVPINTAQSN